MPNTKAPTSASPSTLSLPCAEEAKAAEHEAATKAKKRKEEREEAAEEHKAAAARGDSQAAGAALARAGSMRKRVSIIGQGSGALDGSMVSATILRDC